MSQMARAASTRNHRATQSASLLGRLWQEWLEINENFFGTLFYILAWTFLIIYSLSKHLHTVNQILKYLVTFNQMEKFMVDQLLAFAKWIRILWNTYLTSLIIFVVFIALLLYKYIPSESSGKQILII